MNVFDSPETVEKSVRRRWLLPAVVTGLVLVVVAGALFLLTRPEPYTPEVTGGPSGVVNQDYFDYGTVKGGTWIETTFKIKNVGDQPLNVLNEPYVELIEGCCPPIASITTRTIYPGDEATISMSFMMDGEMVGKHEFLAHIMTDDPVKPDKQVRILSNWVSE